MPMIRSLPLFCMAGLTLAGCGLFYDGPDEATIVRLARQQLISNAPSPAHETAARNAVLEPNGRCVRSETGNDDIYICSVDVTITFREQEADQIFVLDVKRGADNQWVVAKNSGSAPPSGNPAR